MLSQAVSNVLIYVTLAIFLGIGIYAGYKRTKSKSDYLSSTRTQSAIVLGSNWFASSKNKSLFWEKFWGGGFV